MDDVEDLDFAMLMFNLLEYSSNYSAKTTSIWFYSKDNESNLNANIKANNGYLSSIRLNY